MPRGVVPAIVVTAIGIVSGVAIFEPVIREARDKRVFEAIEGTRAASPSEKQSSPPSSSQQVAPPGAASNKQHPLTTINAPTIPHPHPTANAPVTQQLYRISNTPPDQHTKSDSLWDSLGGWAWTGSNAPSIPSQSQTPSPQTPPPDETNQVPPSEKPQR